MAQKSKIIAILCGETAIFCLADGMETKFRVFCASPDQAEKTELPKLMARHPSAPVYILLDSPELTVTRHSLPGVSSMAIGKLASRRLERDFAEDDIKCAVNAGREKDGRKDWRFLFVNAPMTPDVKGWMQFIMQFSNPVMGMYFLPLEALHLAEKIRRSKNNPKDGRKKAADAKKKTSNGADEDKKWFFLSLTQKTGGIRQIVFEDGQLFFTRYVRYPSHAAPESVAGVIEQEMANTVDYLRRLSYTDKDSTRAVVATSSEIKRALAGSAFGGIDTDVMTPYELSMKIGLSGACRIDDKYTDVLAATSFATSKPVMRVFTDDIAKNYRLVIGAKAAHYASVAMVPLFLGLCGFYGREIILSKQQTLSLENKKSGVAKEYNAALAQAQTIDKEQEKTILAAAAIYSELQSAPQPSPLLLSEKFAGASLVSAKIKEMKWSYSGDSDEKTKGPARAPAETMRIGLDFYNSGGSAESLFSNFETFSRNVSEQFAEGYVVEYSKLPDKLTFNNKTDVVPVTITVRTDDGKNKNDAKGNKKGRQ
ncbi:MAG: hypothetical protein ABW189_05735 [Rickettsiales bacterium]